MCALNQDIAMRGEMISLVKVFCRLNMLWAVLCLSVVFFTSFCAAWVLYVDCHVNADPDISSHIVVLAVSVPFFALFLCAGMGMKRLKPLGYWCNILGAILTLFTCLGALYGVCALVAACQPEFKACFFEAH